MYIRSVENLHQLKLFPVAMAVKDDVFPPALTTKHSYRRRECAGFHPNDVRLRIENNGTSQNRRITSLTQLKTKVDGGKDLRQVSRRLGNVGGFSPEEVREAIL